MSNTVFNDATVRESESWDDATYKIPPIKLGRSKADQQFSRKAHAATEAHDWAALELAFVRYGVYLELIETE